MIEYILNFKKVIRPEDIIGSIVKQIEHDKIEIGTIQALDESPKYSILERYSPIRGADIDVPEASSVGVDLLMEIYHGFPENIPYDSPSMIDYKMYNLVVTEKGAKKITPKVIDAVKKDFNDN